MRRFRTQYQGSLRRDHRQSRLDVFWISRNSQRLAHAHGVPLIVDNTFPTPVNLPSLCVGRGYRYPLHHKIYGRPRRGRGRLPSSTAASFDWMAHADKFPGLCTPDDSLSRHHLCGKIRSRAAHLSRKATAQLMRDLRLYPVSPELPSS